MCSLDEGLGGCCGAVGCGDYVRSWHHVPAYGVTPIQRGIRSAASVYTIFLPINGPLPNLITRREVVGEAG